MQSPSKLENLDDLIAQATHYAEHCMRRSGKMAPTLFVLGKQGAMMIAPASMQDDRDKDNFVTSARLVCIAEAATACVLAMEAWLKVAKPGEDFDKTELPSEAFDRQEVVILMGESRDVNNQKILPIIRSGNGKFFGFGESDIPMPDKMEGRFAQILPPNPPTPEHQSLAEAMLKVGGFNAGKLGAKVRLSTPRRR